MRHKTMTRIIFIYISSKNNGDWWKIAAAMRSGSENSFARNKSPLSKDHRRKAWNERKTSCRDSRLIPIRNKQIRHKRQGKYHNNRKRSRSANTHRPDGSLSHAQTRSKDGNFEALLPNLQNNPRKRVNVSALSEERVQNLDRNMHFLPFNLTSRANRKFIKTAD